MAAAKKTFRLDIWTATGLLRSTKVSDWADANEMIAMLRAQLREIARGGRCGSVTLAVHQDGEACDHE